MRQDQDLVGVLRLLAILPLWLAPILLYVLSIGIIWFLRDYFEGFGYNTAFSSQIGDAFLMGCVLMGISFLREHRPVPAFLNDSLWQIALAVVGGGVGFVWFALDRPPQWGDRYHHLVVAPMLVWLGVASAAIILKSGKVWEKAVALLFFFAWAGLVGYDANTGRLPQRHYLAEHGIVLPAVPR